MSRILTPGGNASSLKGAREPSRKAKGARQDRRRAAEGAREPPRKAAKSGLGRLLPRALRAARAAAGYFPLTPLGVLVALGALAGLFGLALPRRDLVLLVVCAAGLGVTALALALSVFTALGLFLALRRVKGPADAPPLELECGVKARTGFSVVSLWFVPLVRVRWSWTSPEAAVESAPRGGRLHEIVTPRRRGRRASIERRLEVTDAFHLARVRFPSREGRSVRALPWKGHAKSLSFTHTLAEGGDLPYPADRARGEPSDFRRYSAGDPMRFILWKTFAKSRQLMVRSPEQAISPARRTIAYLIAGAGDEAAAGVARAALESGSFGSSWVLGADGAAWAAEDHEKALELLAASGECPPDQGGAGLEVFLRRYGSSAGGLGVRILLFAPPLAGPWLERAVKSARSWATSGGRRGGAGGGHVRGVPGHASAGIEAIVCSDGIARRASARLLARLLFIEDPAEAERAGGNTGKNTPNTAEMPEGNTANHPTDTPVGPPLAAAPAAEVASVLRALSAAGAEVLLADRRSGKVYAGAQARAILAATEARTASAASAASATSAASAASATPEGPA